MAVDDKYVMNGVWLTCDKGVTPSRFNVTPKPVQLYDEHFATELDKLPLVNILPFGACSVKYGSPCVPMPIVWHNVMDEGLTVLGARPLLDTSKCQCSVGGQIAIHFTKADAAAAARSTQLDHVDEAADKLETASTWAFWGGIGLAVGGAILCATGVGAPLGAAMIVGGEALVDASTVMASASAVIKGVTKFARNPTLENGLSIVGETLANLALNYVLNKLGGAVVKKLGNWAQKAMNKLELSERASSLANRLLCTVTGHPVDVISGYLYTETVDFELAGPIPLRWERLWNSTSSYAGALGHGWHHSYDLALVVDEAEGYAALRGADGRGLAFDLPALGERAFNRLEKMSLLRDARGYGVLDHGQGLTYRFGPARPDGVRVLVAVENANGFAITFVYDAQGHLRQVVDSAQREFAVSCDGQGRLLTIVTAHPTAPRQRVTLVTYHYNGRGELVRAADALGQAATYRYQDRLLVQETFKNGLSFYFEYVGTGPEARCIHTWGDEGIYDHQLVYDLAAQRTVVTNSLGYATTYVGNEQGLVVQVQDARGGVTRTEYNEFNDVLSQTDPLGRETAYTYDERGNCLQMVLPDKAKWQREYNVQGQVLALIDAVGGRWQWTYDEAGNVRTRTTPFGNTNQYAYTQGLLIRHFTETRQTTEFLYDDAHNVIQMRLPVGTSRRKLYDGWGLPRKLTDERGNVQWREHDLLGRVVALYEPDGNVRRFTYDALDNVTRVQDRHHEVNYSYRGLGRLIRRVEAGVATEFLHDTEEQLRALVNEHGLTYRFELDSIGNVAVETGFDGLSRHYQRDQAGQILTLTLPTGDDTRYTYDLAGRPREVHYSNGDWERYAYRPDGALLEAINATTTVRFERDIAGRVLTETQGPHAVVSAYDRWGHRVKLASSLGAEVLYTRDESGQLTQMQSGAWSALFERDAQGLEVQRSLSSKVRMHWKRDSLGRPTEQRISTGFGQAERTRAYSWQQNNRLAQVQDSQYGLTSFSYDATGNLAATTFADAPTEFRSPDAVGNLFKSVDRLDRRYGPAGKLLAARSTRYTYDAAGNLTRKTTATGDEWQYKWTAAGFLAEVVRPDGTVIRFAYDALGRRVRKTAPSYSTQWVWQGNQPLHEWTVPVERADASPAEPVVTWLFEEGQLAPLAQVGTVDYHSVMCDHLGTPLQMHDKNGQKSWSAELDSYGAVRVGQGRPQDCPFRYQGQYEDVETGLYYNRFRYYDPEAGVYLSQDPTGLAGGDKPYSYVHNPTVLIDPFGLAPWAPGEFGSWFDKASVDEVLANKEDVSSALRGSGGMHEMFPVSMAAKAKELGFTHAELMGKTLPTSGLNFDNVPDRFGNIHSGPHSTGMPLPAGQSGKASSWFHKNLMTDLQGATTKSEALATIERHHTTHCPR
ncbi:MAG: DUF6531 domain-containing protein [Janthinobacterium lividum]